MIQIKMKKPEDCSVCNFRELRGNDCFLNPDSNEYMTYEEQYEHCPLIDVKYCEQNTKSIYKQTGEPAMLEQTAEECAELAQALLKLARAERGESPTPISMKECEERVLEEIADVETCLAQLTAAPWMNMEKIFEQIDEKTERWKRRIAEAGMI